MTSKPLRIAVLFPEFLGDYLMLVPFLYALKACSNQGWIDLFTTTTVSKLAAFHPALRDVIPISEWDQKETHQDLVTRLRGAYDAVYFTNDSLFWIAFKAKISLKIKARYSPLFKLFCKGSSASDLYCSMMHTSERHIHNLGPAFGRYFEPQAYNLDPGIPEKILSDSRQKFGFSGAYAVVAVDNHSCKRYDRVFFVKSVALLVKTVGKVVLVGLKDPHQVGADFGAVSEVLNLVGQTDMTDLFGLIRDAVMLVGIDSGPSHIAAAMGTKSVIMFPPKGASPQLSGGFHPDNYAYKLSPIDSVCALRCSHYPSCPQRLCEEDYRWRDIDLLIRRVLAASKRSWDEKLQETYRLAMPLWVIGNSEAVQKECEQWKEKGYQILYWDRSQFNESRYTLIKDIFYRYHIKVVVAVGVTLPLKLRLLALFFRLTGRWSMGMLNLHSMGEPTQKGFAQFVQAYTRKVPGAC